MASILLTKNEPDPGATPDFPRLVEWAAATSRRMLGISLYWRAPPTPAGGGGIGAEHLQTPGHVTHETVPQARTVLDRDLQD